MSTATVDATTLISGSSADFGSLSIGSTQVMSPSRNILNIGTISATDLIKSTRTTSGQSSSVNGTSSNVYYTISETELAILGPVRFMI